MAGYVTGRTPRTYCGREKIVSRAAWDEKIHTSEHSHHCLLRCIKHDREDEGRGQYQSAVVYCILPSLTCLKLIALHHRTGTQVLIFAVHSKSEDFMAPMVMTTSNDVDKFFLQTCKRTTSDFAIKLESVFLSGLSGENLLGWPLWNVVHIQTLRCC